MDMLQLREKEIFETLKKIKSQRFVLIAGYAANAYTLPRFSVDCDLVVENKDSAVKIAKELEKIGYAKAEDTYGNFLKYEKTIIKNFKVTVDFLIENVSDRKSRAVFSAEWAFRNSELRVLKGKTVPEQLKLRIINPNALVAMKIVSCRSTDIRDVFMLMPQIEDIEWVRKEVSERCEFKKQFLVINDKITSLQFKDNLQGVYGFMDNNAFEKHKKAILRLESV